MSSDELLSTSDRRRGQLVLAAFVLMLGYLLVSHANSSAAILGCPFRAITGLSCFGCGMTRSTAHFLHGDVFAALDYHPFGPLFLIGFAIAAGHHLVQLWRGRPLQYGALTLWRRIEKPAWVVFGLAVVVFGIFRFFAEITGHATPV